MCHFRCFLSIYVELLLTLGLWHAGSILNRSPCGLNINIGIPVWMTPWCFLSMTNKTSVRQTTVPLFCLNLIINRHCPWQLFHVFFVLKHRKCSILAVESMCFVYLIIIVLPDKVHRSSDNSFLFFQFFNIFAIVNLCSRSVYYHLSPPLLPLSLSPFSPCANIKSLSSHQAHVVFLFQSMNKLSKRVCLAPWKTLALPFVGDRNKGPRARGCARAIVCFPVQLAQRFQGSVLSLAALYIWTELGCERFQWLDLTQTHEQQLQQLQLICGWREFPWRDGVKDGERSSLLWLITLDARTHLCARFCQMVNVVATRWPINSLALLLGGKAQSPILREPTHVESHKSSQSHLYPSSAYSCIFLFSWMAFTELQNIPYSRLIASRGFVSRLWWYLWRRWSKSLVLR